MVNYKCLRCGYETHIKTILIRHLTRKNICQLNLVDIDLVEYKNYILSGKSNKDFKSQQQSAEKSAINPPKSSFLSSKNQLKSAENNCKYCEKEFASYKNKWRHENKNCKKKKEEEEAKESMDKLVNLLNEQMKEQKNEFKKELDKRDKEQNNQIKDFKNQLEKRDKQIEELIKKSGINNNNITQNIQNNIKLLAYKDTDISNITDKDIRTCMNHSNMCVPYLIKMIHLNPKKPENHNIYISNLKNGYIMVYDGDKWDTLNRDDVIEDMINNRSCLIEDKVENWLENGKNYPIIMKKFERYLEKKENDIVLNKIKEEIRLMLFNNRNIIKNNNSEIDKCKLIMVENN